MKTFMKRSIGLSLLRVIVSFILIKNAIFYLPMSEQLFGANAIMSIRFYWHHMHLFGLEHFIYPFEIPYASAFFLMVMIVLAGMYLFGVGKAVTGVILYMMAIVLKIRNGYILDGSDNVIQVIMPFLIISDAYRYFRLCTKPMLKFRLSSTLKNALEVVQHYALAGLLIQVCFVYFFTALAKLQGDLWLNGTATYYTMRVDEFRATSWNIPLTENHFFVVLTTYFTLLWEISFAFLVWFKKTKWYVLLLGVVLHVGIWIFMRIDNFSWVMMATYFVFITDEEYKRIYEKWIYKRVVLYYDNWCPKCMIFKRIITELDISKSIHFEGLRNINLDHTKIDSRRALEEMPSMNLENKVVYGFDSILRVSRYTVLLWPVFPFMWMLKVSGLGDWIYRKIAIDRKLVFSCDEECLIQNS